MKQFIRFFALVSIAFLFLTATAFAEKVTFVKEYNYNASDLDSKVSSRTIALEQVKRLLLEELGMYLISETEVKNFRLTKDQITTYSAGIVSAEVIDEKWDGKTYYLKAKVSADPVEVTKSLQNIVNDKQKSKELEDIRKKADDLAKEVERLRKTLEGKSDKAELKQYADTVNQLSAIDWIQKAANLIGDGKDQEKIKEAIDAVTKAIELSPEYSEAYSFRARLRLNFAKSTNYPKIIEDIDKAIKFYLSSKGEKSFELSYYYGVRAKVYKLMGKYQEAITDLITAIGYTDPESPDFAVSGFTVRRRRYALGMAYPDNDKWNKKDFDEIIEHFPKDFRGYIIRGLYYRSLDIYNEKENTELAINDYKKALSLNPKSAVAYYLLGEAYYNKGFQLSKALFPKIPEEYKNSILALSKATQLEPKLKTAYIKRADIYDLQGEYEKAIKDYDKVIELDPEDYHTYYERGRVYKNMGKYHEAIRDFDKFIGIGFRGVDKSIGILTGSLLNDDPFWLPRAYELRGDVHVEMGNYKQAIEDYTKILEISEEYSRKLCLCDEKLSCGRICPGCLFTIVFQNKGDEYDEKLISGLSNLRTDICRTRAAAYAQSGNYQLAVDDLTKSIVLQPLGATYSDRGDVCLKLGNHEDAIKDYSKAIEMAQQRGESPYKFLTKRAFAYKEKKDYQKAIDDINNAIQAVGSGEEKSEAYISRGHIYDTLGNYKQAINDYGAAINISPDQPFAYSGRGLAYEGMADYRHAIKDFDKFIQLMPKDYLGYELRADAYQRIGNYKLSLADFNRAIDLNPQNHWSYYGRAFVNQHLGDDNQAIADLKVAARLGNKEAQDLLRKQGIEWQ